MKTHGTWLRRDYYNILRFDNKIYRYYAYLYTKTQVYVFLPDCRHTRSYIDNLIFFRFENNII